MKYRCWAELRLELGAIEAHSEEDAIELVDASPYRWPPGDYKVIHIFAAEDE